MHLNIIKIQKFYNRLLIVLLSSAIFLLANQENEFNFEFFQNGNYYSFRGTFHVKADPDCLLRVIFDYEHISQYTAGAKSTELLRQGIDCYEIAYTYRKFLIFENKSTWRRTLNRKEQKVIFEMMSSQNNLPLMPQLLSSSGYYQIKSESESYRVDYFQSGKLKDGFLKDRYYAQAKKDAIKFLKEFKQYIETTCC